MKKKRLLAIFAALTIGIGVMSSMTACDLSSLGTFLPFLDQKAEVASISVTTKPTKTDYEVGDKFDPTGMVVTATYADGTEEAVTDYTYAPTGALTMKDTKITITYKEQTTTLRIKIGDPVVAVEKLSDPDLTKEYYLGQTFDVTGMKLKLTYKSGAVEEVEVKDLNGVEYSQEKGLTSADKQITISYAGESWTYDVNLILAVYIEAENGTTNCADATTPTDASAEAVRETLLTLKENELKAATPDISDEDLEKALEDYEASAEYAELAEHYTASGDTYLGNVYKNHYVDFIFESDKAGKGDIEFRMSSQKLDVANGWVPIMMGDCQFNLICDFYVNGVKYDISDDVVLPGGGSEDGPENQLLWVNWMEVLFEDIDFVEGRNVIRLEFKNHNLTANAQTGYNFTANLDCLIINSDECAVNPYDAETEEATPVIEKMELAEQDGKAVLTVSGKVNGANGYIADLVDYVLSGTAGTATVEIATNGDQFTATVDMSKMAVGTYMSTLGGEVVTTEGVTVTEATISIGSETYKLVINEDEEIEVVVDSTRKVVLKEATMSDTPTISMVEENGKVLIKIGGGTATYEIAGYTEEEAKEKIEAEIAKLFYFDLQRYQGAWDQPLGTNFHKANLLEDGAFEIVVDVTNAKNELGDKLMIHFVHAKEDGTFGSGGDLDFKPTTLEAFEKTVDCGDFRYTLTYDKTTCYGLVYLSVAENGAPEIKATAAKLVVENDALYYVLSGTYANYTAEEANAFEPKFNLQGNPYVGTGSWEGDWGMRVFEGVPTINADGTWEIKFDISTLVTGEGAVDYNYTSHFSLDGKDKDPTKEAKDGGPADLKLATSFEQSVEFNGATVKMISVAGSDDGATYWGCIGINVSGIVA